MNALSFPQTPTLLVPNLKLLGYESGFSIRNPALIQSPRSSTDRFLVRVTKLGNGLIKDQKDCDFNGMPYLKSYVFNEDLFEGASESSDLFCINYISSSSDQAIEGKVLRDLEAEWRFRNAQTTGKILTGMVPCRPSGYQYAPIVHLAHYMICSNRVESYVCLANLNVTRLTTDVSDEQNVFEFHVFSLEGKLLTSFEQKVSFNSTFLISSNDILKHLNQKNFCDEAFSVLIRGGQSQFTIYTLFIDKESGAIGGEHSLAPAYYTDAVKSSSTRETFYRNALRKL